MILKNYCERCGARNKECQLTRSHAPQKHLVRSGVLVKCSFKYNGRIYTLCHSCHLTYSRIEAKILEEAAFKMITAHEEYISQ